MNINFLFLGALTAMLGVIFGAFGAHALKALLSEPMLAIWKTAVTYQMWHALGLAVIGLWQEQRGPSQLLCYAGLLMLGGILLFSGSLYLLSLLNMKWLGIITPFGGLCFILAWLLLALSCRQASEQSKD